MTCNLRSRATTGRAPTAVITGASSGIGAAAALRLVEEGFDVVLGARRAERLEQVAAECGGRPVRLDVTDPDSVDRFAAEIDSVDVLINNAGIAVGLEKVAELTEAGVEKVWQTNVMGLIRVTQALLPRLESGGNGHIVNVGSVAGFETYPGGAGYTASKHAVRAITRTLRMELIGKPIRITEIAPGHVETEFAVTRFGGDEQRAERVYEGFTPLRPADVADCVAWAVTRPPNVNIDEIVVRPLAQASATLIARKEDS
nr:SDR family NAD(P)-dependent oxidoreductase [Actinomycetota bacterium]